MELTEEEVERILRLVDELDYGEIHLEVGQLRIHLVKTPAGQHLSPIPPPAAYSPASIEMDSGLVATSVTSPSKASQQADATPVPGAFVVAAPIAGTFFRAPAPGAKPFVDVGQRVMREDTVCVLEVMKLFQSVSAGVDGEILQVLAENAQPVVQGQPLFAIRKETE